MFTAATLAQSGVVAAGVSVRSLGSRAALADLLDSHPGLKTHFRSQTHSVQTLLMQAVARDEAGRRSPETLACQTDFKNGLSSLYSNIMFFRSAFVFFVMCRTKEIVKVTFGDNQN